VNRTVLFVCPHGAAKSRVAAACFNRIGPTGWMATSAGLDPGPELSQTAARMLAGTDAAGYLDLAPPRSIAEVTSASRVIGIDCAPSEATDHWALRHPEFDSVMRDEIRTHVESLAAELGSLSDA